MWNIGEHRYPQVATFWSVKDSGQNWATVSLSTSRKDKEGNWHNSNWGFVRFVGKASEGLDELNEKDRIEIVSGGIQSEPYVKDGEKTYPKSPQIVVFAWKKYEWNNNSNSDETHSESVIDEEQLPF